MAIFSRGDQVSAGEQDTVAFEWRGLSKNRIWKPPRPMWQAANDYWNSGMFLFRAGRYLEELKNIARIFSMPVKSDEAPSDPDLDFIRVDEEAFFACRKSRWITRSWNVRQMLLWCRWMRAGGDVGSWSSLWEINPTAEGNVATAM
ncbi:sugar phosphate nucleotidyltransferase [Escherichia coli]|nr:sugar phosphate nucleotidyltransferase [Escherichia coli]